MMCMSCVTILRLLASAPGRSSPSPSPSPLLLRELSSSPSSLSSSPSASSSFSFCSAIVGSGRGPPARTRDRARGRVTIGRCAPPRRGRDGRRRPGSKLASQLLNLPFLEFELLGLLFRTPWASAARLRRRVTWLGMMFFLSSLFSFSLQTHGESRFLFVDANEDTGSCRGQRPVSWQYRPTTKGCWG